MKVESLLRRKGQDAGLIVLGSEEDPGLLKKPRINLEEEAEVGGSALTAFVNLSLSALEAETSSPGELSLMLFREVSPGGAEGGETTLLVDCESRPDAGTFGTQL